MKILIAGCGYVGSALGAELARDGNAVYGLRRDPSGLPEGIVGIAADLTAKLALPEVDRVVYCASPSERSERAYEDAYVRGLANVLDATRAPVIFTSSTAVYAQDDGSWVDESSPVEGNHALREAEELVRSAGGVVLRLAGIYGPGRTWLVRRVERGETSDGARFGNRIHREDCAGVLKHLLSIDHPLPVYVGVDCDPAPLSEVYAFVASLLGAPAASRGAGATESSRGGNKRCSNRALIASGYAFRVPSYREGYPAIVREHLAR